MWEAPIVAEVHRIREKLAEECHFDVGEFFENLRRRQQSLGSRLRPQQKHPEPPAEASPESISDSSPSRSADAAPAASCRK